MTRSRTTGRTGMGATLLGLLVLGVVPESRASVFGDIYDWGADRASDLGDAAMCVADEIEEGAAAVRDVIVEGAQSAWSGAAPVVESVGSGVAAAASKATDVIENGAAVVAETAEDGAHRAAQGASVAGGFVWEHRRTAIAIAAVGGCSLVTGGWGAFGCAFAANAVGLTGEYVATQVANDRPIEANEIGLGLGESGLYAVPFGRGLKAIAGLAGAVAAFDAAEQYVRTGGVDPWQVLTAAGTGGAIGTGGQLLAKGLRVLGNAVRRLRGVAPATVAIAEVPAAAAVARGASAEERAAAIESLRHVFNERGAFQLGSKALDTTGWSGAPTARGGIRNPSRSWQEWHTSFPADLSPENVARIKRGEAAVLDSQFADANPALRPALERNAQAGLVGPNAEVMEFHHLRQGPLAVPLPQSLHRGAGQYCVLHAGAPQCSLVAPSLVR
ncbi:MAG: hypothetical protein QME96_07310 [Myxococcota bacterium]|nr:hypothetical protein [Myxococcota bacterium]